MDGERQDLEGGVGDIFVIKSARSTASSDPAIHLWYKSMSTSVPASSREPIAPSARYDREGRVSWRNPAFTLTTSSTTTINLREDLHPPAGFASAMGPAFFCLLEKLGKRSPALVF